MNNAASQMSPSPILMTALSLIHQPKLKCETIKKEAQDVTKTEPDATSSTIPDASTPTPTSNATSAPATTLASPLDIVPTHDSGPVVESSPPKLRIAFIMSSLCACVFVAAIDVTIITTAVSAITSNFQSASGYQWVASSYVLGSTGSTPSWGKLPDIWGRKPILLFAIIIFFSGSLICALAESMAVFLAGRAIQGVGASGLLTLVNIAISDLFSMRDRAFYYGLTSVVWAVASGVGPVLGGIFAQQVTWRWCFWLNLPIAGVVFFFLLFTMPQDNPGTPVLAGLKVIDWIGSLLIIGATLMLLLGLNFGGVTFAWNSATVINLILFGVFAGFLFGINEWKLVKYPVIPPRLFHDWSSVGSFGICFCQSFIMMGVAYYLPLYFQAVLGAGPLLSGVYLLPFILSNTGMAAGTGVYIQKTGKYIPHIYLGLVLIALGTGLLIDLDVEKSWTKIIIYQIIVGAGIGMNFEGPLLAVQATIDIQDIATATATMGFTRMLSTAISAIIGGVVFQNQMLKESSDLASLGLAVADLLRGGDSTANIDVIRTLPFDQQMIVKGVFHRSLRMMWIMYVAFAALGLFAGCFIAIHPLSKNHQSAQVGLFDTANDAIRVGHGGTIVRRGEQENTAENTTEGSVIERETFE